MFWSKKNEFKEVLNELNKQVSVLRKEVFSLNSKIESMKKKEKENVDELKKYKEFIKNMVGLQLHCLVTHFPEELNTKEKKDKD